MSKPERIVSLLPSATEILCVLGLQEQLVAISHECDYPLAVKGLPVITGSRIAAGQSSHAIDAQVREYLQDNAALYSLDSELLQRVNPDLIVTQALCDVCAVSADEVEAATCGLTAIAEVVNLEPANLEDVFTTIAAVGDAAGVSDRATSVLRDLRQRLAVVQQRTATIPEKSQPTVVMLEWVAPPFNAGHWTPELIEYAGGIDLLGSKGQPSHTIDWDAVRKADPDVLVFACCGFGIDRTLVDVELARAYAWWPELSAVRNQRVYVVDGNYYFNRPGPRLIDSLEVLAHLLHPAMHRLPLTLKDAFVALHAVHIQAGVCSRNSLSLE